MSELLLKHAQSTHCRYIRTLDIARLNNPLRSRPHCQPHHDRTTKPNSPHYPLAKQRGSRPKHTTSLPLPTSSTVAALHPITKQSTPHRRFFTTHSDPASRFLARTDHPCRRAVPLLSRIEPSSIKVVLNQLPRCISPQRLFAPLYAWARLKAVYLPRTHVTRGLCRWSVMSVVLECSVR